MCDYIFKKGKYKGLKCGNQTYGASFKCKSHFKMQEYNECPICKYKKKHFFEPSCGHIMCLSCSILLYKMECPYCRLDLSRQIKNHELYRDIGIDLLDNTDRLRYEIQELEERNRLLVETLRSYGYKEHMSDISSDSSFEDDINENISDEDLSEDYD